MNKKIFSCCKLSPKFIITYNVSDQEKKYYVCDSCYNLDFFSKFIISKEKL